MQRDPLGYVDGMSLYQYLTGDPLAYRDPKGTDSPGCDAVPGVLESECALECCAMHDKMYDELGCDASSWYSDSGCNSEECDTANKLVMMCLNLCSLPWPFNREGSPDRPDYYCAVHGVWFDDPDSPHMNHSTS
jgi:hypothetical protein